MAPSGLARRALTTAALLASVGLPALAQSYPSKPITIIVPFAAGGGTDVATRAVAAIMGKQLGTSFVVDNKPGGNSFIGAQAAARAAADGYTLFMTSLTTHSINPHVFRSLPYAVNDFVPVGFLAATLPVLITQAGNSATSVKDVIAQAAGKPGGLNFAVPNASSRFATEMFALLGKVPTTSVNFNSTPQAHAEVASGRVDYIFGDFSAGGGLIEAGKLKPLAVAGAKRLSMFPNIPTMAEAGLPGVEVEIWAGLFAPKGTPADAIDKLNAALNTALQDPQVREIFRKGAQDSRAMTPAEFGQYVDTQYQHWGQMVKTLKIQPE